MKKILTLSISLMLVIGIVSLAKSSDIDTVWNSFATSYCKDRHMVMASDGTIAVLYYDNGKIRAKRSIDFGATWTNLAGGTGFTIIEEGDYIEDGEGGYWTVDRDYSVCRGAGDDIYVAYDKEGHIYFKKLTYSAVSRTWAMSGARVVCNWYTARNPSIIRANNGNVWVAFATEMSGAWGLDSVYSPDEFELTRYEQTVLWGWGAGGPYFPVLVIRNGNPFLVYQDGSTSNMKWSYWNEAVWSTPEIIPLDGEMGDAPWFSVAMLGNDVHLACDAGYGVRAESINMAHTYYNGAWQPGQTISHWIWDKQPSLTTSNGELWCFISTYDNNVAYKKWSGGTWDADWTAVTNTGGDCYPTTLLSSPSFIPVAWTCDAEGKVKFTIVGVAPPPAPGNVDDGVAGWSSDNTPTFTWDVPLDPSGIAGYWWAVDDPTPETGGVWTTARTATTAPLADGIHTFYVAAQNGLGLIGYAGSHECWIDATPPPAPTVSSPTHPNQVTWYNNNDPSFNWSTSDISGITGYSYVLDQNSGTIPDDTSEGTGTSFIYTDVLDGTWYFHIKAQNGSGLWSVTAHYKINIDASGPPAPVVSSATHPDQAIWYSNNDPSFSWTCDDISGITGYSYVLDQNSGTIPDDTSEGTGTSKNYTDIVDGTWWFHVKARNGCELWGATVHYKVNIDASGPPAPVVTSPTHPDPTQWYSNNDPSFSWTCDDISGITGYSYVLDQNSGTIPDDTSEGTGTSKNYTDIVDGTWWFHVKAQDGSGLWGATAHCRINIDTSAPVAPVVNSPTHPDQATWYSNNDPSFNWTCDDISGITGYSYVLDQNPGTIPDNISEGTGTTKDYTDIADGTRWFHIKAQNGVGLWGATAHYRINIDSTIPAAPVVNSLTHPDQALWYNNNDPSLTWTASNPSGIIGYSYLLDQNAGTVPDNISEGVGTAKDYTDIADGTWWFHVKAQNGVGIWGDTAHYRINIDTSPPGAPIVNSPTHPDQATWYSNDDPSFGWTCNDISGITGYSYVLDQNPGTIPDNISEGPGTIKDYTDIADGTRWFHVKALNGSGLWGGTAHYRINIDATIPAAPVVTSGTHPDQATWYSNNDPSFSWTCSDISGITGYSYVLDQNPMTIPDDSSEGTSTSKNYTDVGDGTWYFHIKAQNGSGLWGVTAHYRINIDASGPGAPVVNSLTHPDQATWYSNDDPSFIWSASDISGITGYSYVLDQNPMTIPDDGSEGAATSRNYTDVADGTWWFHIKAQNGTGVWGGTAHYRVNIDATPPGTPVVNSPTHPDQAIWYDNNDPSFNWSTNDISGITGYSYVLDQNPGTIPDDTSEGAGTSRNYTDVADGTWYFHVKAQNGSGLWGSTAHYRINVDTSGPNAPVVNSPTHPDQNSWYSNNDPSFNWSASDPSGITGYSYVLDQNPGTIPDNASEGLGTSRSYLDVADGTWYFHVKARDGSSLWGGAAHYRINIDTSQPGAPVINSPTHPDQAIWYSNNDPSFNWSASDISGITGYSYVLDQNPVTIPDDTSEGAGTSRNYADVANGIWYFHVKAQNGSSLWGGTAHYRINIDATAPEAPVVNSPTHPDQATWYNNNDPSFNWSASDVSGITGYSYELDRNPGTIPDDTSEGIANSTNYTDVADGISYFHVKARNGSGLWGETAHYRINVDALGPGAPVVNSPTHPDQATWYNNNDPSFIWSASDDSGIIGYSYVLDQNLGTVPDDASEGIGTSTNYTDVADGTWYFHVKAMNGSGLWGGTAHYRINIDVTGPNAPVVSSLTHPGQGTWYSNNDPSFNWTASDISGISGYSYELDQNPGTIPDEASEGTATSTSYNNVADGTWYFHVRARNGSGLWGATAHYRVNIDATPPNAPLVNSPTHPNQNIWYVNDDPSFSWNADDISGITGYSYVMDQIPGTIPDNASEGIDSFVNYTDVAGGTWYFHVKVQNGSGLWGGAAHYRVNIGAGYTVYRITSTVTSARTIDPFKLIIELVDPNTGQPKSDANNSFNLNACTVDFKDAPGEWSTGDPLVLNNGRAEIWVTYDTVGRILFKVSDNLGNTPAYTDPIEIRPAGLRYELSAPARAEAGKEFALTVKLIDTGAGNIVTLTKYDREVRLVARSSPDGNPAEGELKVKSFYLQGGVATVAQSYNLSHNIYIVGLDSEVYDPSAESGRTGVIEVIGAPKTALRLDGIYNEMNAALYVRPTTRVIIESVSDIVAETILYRDKDGDWNTYAEPFTLSPGSHSIEYYGIDKYGHKEGVNRSKPIYVSFFGSGEVSNRPNPFKAGREPTLIEYNLKEPSNVIITIYDIFGQEVWHERYEAGENGGKKDNSVPWDGRNLSGKVVANGGYICRVWIENEKRHMVRKIAVAK